ncbi:cytoplasmic protein [Tremella mesenterica]|uniref:Cytoplasmic protein n=1 Tax=Tremella mesenterica TaxID=5217 RepID=A0A4Q1BCU4_TREME|nr:cytoplasmic protein [Tremella mesenterica]
MSQSLTSDSQVQDTAHSGVHESGHELLATELLPRTNATLTIRVIKSFEFRTQKSLVFKGLNLEMETVGNLKARCENAIATTSGFKPYRNVKFDTLKLYTQAHGHKKTTNLIINLDHEDWILDDPEATLASIGAENETELSFFNREAYEKFKLHPEVKWD